MSPSIPYSNESIHKANVPVLYGFIPSLCEPEWDSHSMNQDCAVSLVFVFSQVERLFL